MSEDRTRAIEKVQKLLNLTVDAGAGEEEAKTAIAKAQQIMLKYNLTMVEVAEHSGAKTETYVARKAWSGNGWPWQMGFVLPIIRGFFFVKPLHVGSPKSTWRDKDRCEIELFGLESNVEVATLVLNFLLAEYKHQWQVYRRNTRASKSAQRGFYEGIQIGLMGKLYDDREELYKQEDQKHLKGTTLEQSSSPLSQTGLIIRKAEDKLKEEYESYYEGQLVRRAPSREINDDSGSDAGVKAGKGITIKVQKAKGKLTGRKGIEE